MANASEWLANLVTILSAHGTWGILVLSFIDALFPLPNVVDGLVLYVSYLNQDLLAPALAAVIGSTAGTVVLYLMIRYGSRFIPYGKRTARRLDKVTVWIGKYDLLAIFVAAVLPPPFPLKTVVVSAGLLRFNLARFLLAYGTGRAVRFFAESVLAVMYGEAAVELFKAHYPLIALAVLVLIVIGALVFRLLAAKRRGPLA